MNTPRLLLVLAVAAFAAACDIGGAVAPTAPAPPLHAGGLIGGGLDVRPDTTTQRSDTTKT